MTADWREPMILTATKLQFLDKQWDTEAIEKSRITLAWEKLYTAKSWHKVDIQKLNKQLQ